MNGKAARVAMALLASLTFLMAGLPVSGLQTPQSGESSDYYIVYTDNYDDGSGADIFITSTNSTYGTVEIPGIGFSQGFTVQADTITTIDVPLAAEVQGSDVIADLGIRITANDNITVYFLNPGEPVYTNDAYVALPAEALGTEYIVLAWPDTLPARGAHNVGFSEFAIVAPFNDTEITITPSVSTGTRLAGVPYTITLDQFQTYTLQGDDDYEDLTGTVIQSAKPVSVYAGSRCADIPAAYECCDHIIEQMTPTTAWGEYFVTIPLASRIGGDFLRILASVDGTTANITGSFTSAWQTIERRVDLEHSLIGGGPSGCCSDGGPPPPGVDISGITMDTDATVVLNRGEFYEMLATGPVEITADQPVMVAQYATGQSWGGLGDPFMMVIAPAEQFLQKYTFLTPTGYSNDHISIIAPTSAIDSLVLDGSAIDPGLFSPIGSGGFSGAAISVDQGSHTITGSEAFGIYAYGFGHCVSYGYPGGLGSGTINPPPPPDTPLIIVPGLAGTRIVNDQGELWLDIDTMVDDAIDHWGKPDSDFLDVTQLNTSGTGPLKPEDPHYASVGAGTVLTRVQWYREFPVIGPIDIDLDVYQGLVDHFESQGYVLGETLFLFGYDWRRDLSETAQQLDDLIDGHRNGGQVNVVAHSMGGLVSRYYILDPGRAAKVENLVILGTPFLGAPEAFKGLYLGDDFGINEAVHDRGLPGWMWLINEDKIKQIARNWPGIYEILPSERYFDVYEDGYIQEDRDIDGDGAAKGALNYQETKSVITSLLNDTVRATAEQFHSDQFDGFDSGTNGVNVYLIVGVGLGTKERIRFWEEKKWLGFKTVEHTSWWYGNGDQTVMQRSADLHDDNTDYRGDAGIYYANVIHGDLPKNSHVQQQISQLFASNLDPVNSNISLTPDPWPFEGYWQEVNSPVELHIYDELGNHLGPTGTDVIEYGIKNAQYDWVGEDKSAFVPKGIGYTAVLSGTEEGEFDLRLRDVAGGVISTTVLFQDIPIFTGTIASVSVTGEDGYVMAYDEDGDGIFDAWLEPTVILDPEESLDTVPPETTIIPEGETDEFGWFIGDVEITMLAEDNPGGSGVDRIEYSLDEGETVQVYTGPFTVNVNDVDIVYAKALDVAGNQQFPMSSSRLSPLYEPVRADFTGNPTSGTHPLEVAFTNTSTGDYTTSQWDFGDGEASTLKSPTHIYTLAGTYTVSLTVSGPGGTDSLERADYVMVTNPLHPIYLPLVLRRE